jgi:hypothetical protein
VLPDVRTGHKDELAIDADNDGDDAPRQKRVPWVCPPEHGPPIDIREFLPKEPKPDEAGDEEGTHPDEKRREEVGPSVSHEMHDVHGSVPLWVSFAPRAARIASLTSCLYPGIWKMASTIADAWRSVNPISFKMSRDSFS